MVLKYQQRVVEEMLRHSLPYPHVLYCMDNETSGDEAWAVYWAEFIQERARAAGVDVFLTEMWDDWNLQAKPHRRTFDHPERFAFADVSQNNHQKGQTHWDNFQWARDYLAKPAAPDQHRENLWRRWRPLRQHPRRPRTLVAASDRRRGGSAFSSAGFGAGLLAAGGGSIRAARKLASLVNFWELSPALDLLRNRDANEAYLAAKPGAAYALYFPEWRGGRTRLARTRLAIYEVRWIEIATGEWGRRATGAAAIGFRWPRRQLATGPPPCLKVP